MSPDLYSLLYDISAWVIPVLLAVTLHEASHGYIAYLFGDDTAKRAGRISLNPFTHIDRFGTIILPALLMFIKSPVVFGYAKPVPVDFRALRPLRLGSLCVAIAGPGMNVLLAAISALLLHMQAWVTPEQAPWLYMNLYRSIIINCTLAVFNMLPILPLDGGRVLRALLPGALGRAYAETERFGMVLVFALLMAGPLLGMYGLMQAVGEAADWLLVTVLLLAGSAN